MYDTCAVAVNVVFNIAPSLKLVTALVVFKFCVPPADVPTLIVNAVLELFGLKTLTCIL